MRKAWLFVVAGAILAVSGVSAAAVYSYASANKSDGAIRSDLGLASGAKVTRLADGGVSFQGALTPKEANEAHQMNLAADAGPGAIECSGPEANLSCTPVEDSSVSEAIRSGQTIYGRTVYGDVSSGVDSGKPVLGADELLCGDLAAATGVMSCHTAAAQPPVISAAQKMLVTYTAYATHDGRIVVGRSSPAEIELRSR